MVARRDKSLTFRENKEIIQSLDAIANRNGFDRSDVLRMIIRDYFKAESEKKKRGLTL